MKNKSCNELCFGTDGIRETIGQNILTIEQLSKLGFVIGQWFIERYGTNKTILIGHDTRISCPFIKASLESGLLLHPLTILDAHILPTPAVCHLVKKSAHIDAGIIITASHNGYQDNGIKIIDSNGMKIKQETTKIEKLFNNYSKTSIQYNQLGQIKTFKHAAEQYISDICSKFSPFFLDGITVAIDCAHGAFSTIAICIFETLGANVIAIGNKPDGKNINDHCGALYPDNLIKAVHETGAHIGFACDGDGDRLVVITKDGIKKDGDDILALLSLHHQYKHESIIVGTTMSNEGLNTWLAQHNKKLLRANVGEPSVIEEINRNKLMLGGEPSGHIVLNDFLGSSDSIITALRLLEVIIKNHNWQLKTFEHFPQINLTVPIKNKISLDQPQLANIINDAHNKIPNGRLIVRYSGTEPLLRIMAEDNNKKRAYYIAQKIAEQIQQELC